ncbi:putative HlyD family type I secretion protein [Enterovibrio coralii]|uniref:AprE-like beta-barrel domain-containing protein n=1 Tax=Enterovibrio coralii TaxID=294935 RepID=A0A135IB33_9GAMM|nr:HlyD family efflux transporter periplasmic adaptor subunit [Enterovibrio coralii]KXF82574.1 hypothetical protein ATN88_25130 [Enterovibrio coralii]
MRSIPVSYSPVKTVTFSLFIFVSIFVLVFSTGNYTYTTTVTGSVVDPSITKITATTTGQVFSITNSSSANKGEPIATIVSDNTESADASLLSNNATYTEIQQLINDTQKRMNHEKETREKTKLFLHQAIDSVNSEIKINLSSQKTLLDTRKKINALVKSTQELFKKGHISHNDLTKKELELNNIDTDINTLRGTLSSLEVKKLDYYNQLENSTNTSLSTESQLTDQLFQYRRLLKEFSERYYRSITSPIDLITLKPLVDIGEQIVPGDVLLVGKRITDKKMYFQFKVSQDSVGFINDGDKIIIRVIAFPYEKFGVLTSKVTSISEFSSLDRNQRLNNSEDGFYYMNAEVYPSQRIPLTALKDGMKVEAVIQLQKTNLIKWLFLPISKSLIRNPDF